MAELSLGDKFSYLSLRHLDSGKSSRICIHALMSSVLAAWTPTTRVSPIIGVEEYNSRAVADFVFPGDTFLLLLGPIHPLKVADILEKNDRLWLTFGLFNCVVIPENEGRCKDIIKAANASCIRFEAWDIRDGIIIGETYSPKSTLPANWNRDLVVLADKIVHPELDDSLKEYCPLMATALARSLGVVPSIAEDVAMANRIIIYDYLNVPPEEQEEFLFETQGMLTTINAGLSRLTSQSFSGSSPISTTECHFWSHSLLGTGTANFALSNIASSIRSRLGPMLIVRRIERLADPFTPPPDSPVPEEVQDTDRKSNFWDGGLLPKVKLRKEDLGQPIFPQFTFFSGRDGFRATLTTLSAPLASVTACNSLRWSLMTLSHEISHIIIRGVLGNLLPLPNNNAELLTTLPLIKRKPYNYYESAKKLVINTMIGLHYTEVEKLGEDKTGISVNELRKIIDSWFHEVEEIFVHVFDYLFFFDSLEDYIRSIWLSWSVIPNISNRVPEYVIRSLCAALTNNLRRDDGEEHAKNDVVRILTGLRDPGLGGSYVEEALILLNTSWESSLKNRLIHRRRLVKFVRGFLYWPEAASELRKEKWLTSRETGTHGYSHKRRIIGSMPLSNPLRFFEEFSNSITPNSVDSLWLMQTGAYNYDDSP